MPTTWAEQWKDSQKAHPPFCDHCEVYFGTSPRFLTTTFNAQHFAPIPCLEPSSLTSVESWGLTPMLREVSTAPVPILEQGTPLELAAFKLNSSQKNLISGQPVQDRSSILHGLVIALVDQGAPREDVLATITSNEHLWRYCLEHRRDDLTRAFTFAKDEVTRGYDNSETARAQRLIGFNEAWRPTLSVVKPPEKPEPPAWPAPFQGPMAEAVNAALKVAPKPQPALTTMAALVGMAAGCGGVYKLSNGGRLNLYGCGLAPTGYGKDVPRQLAVLIAHQAGALSRGRPASGQGAEDALVPYQGILFEIDEFAHLLAAINDRRASSYLTDLSAVLLRLYSSGNGTYNTRVRAGTTAPPRSIPHPAVSVIGFATPEKFGQAVTVDCIAEGLPGRTLFVNASDNPRPRRVREALTLPAAVKHAALGVTMARRLQPARGDITIGVTADADRLLEELQQEFDQRSRSSGSPFAAALHVRSYEKTERIAGVLAVWDRPEQPVIDIDHVTWAAQAVRASDAAVLSFVDEFMHGGQTQADAAKLRGLIRRIVNGELTTVRAREQEAIQQGWAPRSMLLRTSKLDGVRLGPALTYLFDLGDLQFYTFPGKHSNGREERLEAVRLTEGAT